MRARPRARPHPLNLLYRPVEGHDLRGGDGDADGAAVAPRSRAARQRRLVPLDPGEDEEVRRDEDTPVGKDGEVTCEDEEVRRDEDTPVGKDEEVKCEGEREKCERGDMEVAHGEEHFQWVMSEE